jgi:WD domain, G-beta repeat
MPQLNARPQSTTASVRSKESISGKLWACAPCFSSDGSVVYCSCSSAIKAISVATGEQLFRLLGHTDEVTALALHPNGAEGGLLSGSRDCTVRQWDVRNDSDSSSERCLRVFRLSQPVLSMLLQPHLPQGEPVAAAAGYALYLLTQWATDSQLHALEAAEGIDEMGSDAALQKAAENSTETPQTVKRKRKRNRAAVSTDADLADAATATAAEDSADAAPVEPVAESAESGSKRRRRSKADKTATTADSVAAAVDDDSITKPEAMNGKARSNSLEAPAATVNSSPKQDKKAVRRSARAAKAAAAAAADSDADTETVAVAAVATAAADVEAAAAGEVPPEEQTAESLKAAKKERAKLAAAARKVAKKADKKRMKRAKKSADRPDNTAATGTTAADDAATDTEADATAAAAEPAEPAAVESKGMSSKQLRKLKTAAGAAATAAAAAAASAAAAQSSSKHHWQVLELALPTTTTISNSDSPAVTRRIAAVRAPLALAVALTAQGRRWVVQAKDKLLVITDAATGEQWGGAAGRKLKRITAMCAHVNSGVVATGHANGSITLWYGLAAAAEAALARRAAGGGSAASDEVEGLVKTRTLHWHAHAVQCISFRYNTTISIQLLHCFVCDTHAAFKDVSVQQSCCSSTLHRDC